MDCCGHGHAVAPQNWVSSTPPASVRAMLAGAGPPGSTVAARTAETAAAALGVLRNSISVDVHSHGGKTGIVSKAPPSRDLADAMRAGSLAVACLADVPDWPVLGRNAEGVLAAMRAPQPGELYRYHLDRLAWIDELVAEHGVRRALCAADLEAAHMAGEPAIIADVEGLDFLELKLERLEEAHRRGIRHLQLVHYTPNDIGDFQTGAVTHQGLSEFGAEVIRACDRLGFVCDLAHATEDMAKEAVKVATKPLVLSHTALLGSRAMGPTPLTGRQMVPIMRGRSPRPAVRSGSGTSFGASSDTSTASRRWPKSSASIMSASAPTSSTRGAASRITPAGRIWSRRCCAAASPPKRPARSPAATTCASSALRSADRLMRRQQ
jgi:membrane dipeptidase